MALDLSTRRKIDLSYAIGLLILVLVGVFSYVSIRQLQESQSRVVHTGQELRALGNVLADMVDAETSQRGYIIARQEEFLEPYNRAIRAIGADIAELRRLGVDEQWRGQIDTLEVLAKRKLEGMRRTVELGQAGRFEEAAGVVRLGEGKQLMDEIRLLIGRMIVDETAVLDDRMAAAERRARQANGVILMGFVIALGVVALSRRRIISDLLAREQAEAALAASERGMRGLYEIASSQELSFEEKLQALLELGSERLGLPIGVVSHVTGERFEVIAGRDPRGSISSGDVYPLADTYCSVTLRDVDLVGVEHVGPSAWKDLPCYARFGLESYIGVPIVVEHEPYGTLCFSDPEPRQTRFSEQEKDLLRLMSQWIGREIERRRSQEAMRQREERYRTLVETASDLIYTTDDQGRFTYANPVALRTIGYSAEELIGRPFGTLVREDWRDATEAFYEDQVRSRRQTSYYEFPALAKDGHEVWLGQNVALLTEEGRVVGAQSVARDITKQREVERLKEEFLSVVSHELRTPLTAIRGSLGLLASGNMGTLEKRGQRMLEIAASNTDRLVRLINDLLDIEKIESGKISIEPREIRAADLARQAGDEVRPLADRAGVHLDIGPMECRVRADPDRVHQVLINLLSNAIKFSDRGDTVALSVDRCPGQVVFHVRDQGRGIPPDKLEIIFDKFQQVDSSDARQKGGTGLGLSIARSIVHQHGGEIWVESEWGRGSTFSFFLPDADGLPEAGDNRDAIVLICETDVGLCARASEMLRNRGYRVITVQSGERAMEIASGVRPEAILLDLVMPGTDAQETLRRLSTSPATREIPVVIFSVIGEDEGVALPAQIAEWVRKPGTEPAIVGAVDRAVAAGRGRCDVLLVEDDDDLSRVVAEALHARGMDICRARSAPEAIELSRRMQYDLLVLDLALPGADGFSVVDWLRRHDRLRAVPLLVYTARDLDDGDRERLRLGPTEFMTKGRVTVADVERRVVEILGGVVHPRTEQSDAARADR